MNINTYSIQARLHESSRSTIYRALDTKKGKNCIIKCLRSRTPEDVVGYMQEHSTGRHLSLHGLYGGCRLEKHEDMLMLVFEDMGGRSLDHGILQGKTDLREGLFLAIAITEALERIHRAKIIHKNINPTHIVCNPENGHVEIIDFSTATILPSEAPRFHHTQTQAGSMAYISPEQTGRMNRDVDYRTDYYALGVTLYQLFSGTLPFTGRDPLELIHCHIARQPPEPHQHRPDIPKNLSRIIMKLLAKNPEDRYQSIPGIRFDLETCLEQIRKGREEYFEIGQKDGMERFQISQRLYGRNREVDTLVQSFEQASQGGNASVFIGGYSGCGKSTLVKEMYKPITQSWGYFIRGKFDQLHRSIPYSALVQAFSGLMRQYLGMGKEALDARRKRLDHALGSFGQIMVDRLPDLEDIIGPQPPVPEVGMAEASNRFHLIFKKFLMACCEPARPLTLFLDDLQWADPSSLALIEQIGADDEVQDFFLIAAYRDNEVDEAHPLKKAMETILKKNPLAKQMFLGPLGTDDIRQMVADTLHRPAKSLISLTDLISDKTGGNPFFVNQFLKTLHEEKKLSYNPQEQAWDWDMEGIRSMGITGNVVDLMVARLEKLPLPTRNLLSGAACIGNTFTLDILAIIAQKTRIQVFKDLLPAALMGVIHPLSQPEPAPDDTDAPLIVNQHRFLHDRVQEAAYRLIPEEDKAATHLETGRLMQNSDPEFKNLNLFDVTRHLNAGIPLIKDASERLHLARLNLKAARKARSVNAIDAAAVHASAGLSLLPEDIQEQDASLWLELMLIQSDCHVFQGDFEKARMLFDEMLKKTEDEMDRSRVHERQLQVYISSNRMEEALGLTTGILKQWGIVLKTNPSRKDWLVLDKRFREGMQGRSIEELLDLPSIDNPRMEAALRLLMNTLPAAYQTRSRRPWCMISLMTSMMNIGLEYGHSDISAYAYAAYSYSITDQHRYEDAWRFGRLALDLNETMGNPAIRGKLLIYFSCYTQFWREPFASCQPLWEKSYHAALESGDLIHVAFLFMNKIPLRLAQSPPLPELYGEARSSLEITQKTNYLLVFFIVQMNFSLISNLTARTDSPESLDTDILKEKDYTDFMEKENNSMGMAYYHAVRLISATYFGRWQEAIFHGEAFEKVMLSVPGMIIMAEHGFYFALAIAAEFQKIPEEQQPYYADKFAHYTENNRIWAKNCPENFLCRHLLLQGEKARLSGNGDAALSFYKEAAGNAKKNGFLNIEALCNETAARFWLEKRFITYAAIHIKDAMLGYQLWGAEAKLLELRRHFPEIEKSGASGYPEKKSPLKDSLPDTKLLDLDAILRATRAISGEIVLDRLLQTLMTTMLESAGAESALLLTPKAGGTFRIDAHAHTRWQEGSYASLVTLTPKKDALSSYPLSLARYVAQSCRHVVMDDARTDHDFSSDAYILSHQPLSIFCLPIMRQSKLLGVLYLENNLTTGAFHEKHIALLSTLCSQAAISIENARLYEQVQEYSKTLEERVAERTEKLEELNRRLRDLAHQDGLTGVANRRHCDVCLEQAWNAMKRQKKPLTIIMCDVDFFKNYNDSYGHQKGDDCLIGVAAALRAQIHRPDDFLARYGGEEFILILPDTCEKGAKKIAEDLRQAVQDMGIIHESSAVSGRVTISAGTATCMPSDNDTVENLVRQADAALYRAKEKGRNCVVSA
ncbi:diguanylate cyclase (GGDEF)-like protein [Desulfobotulus alkaliphilus]|uniref:Diguanylate cyclase (GGDEF)-like protein n=1 Tax=Desulfobotulus alkaliphilus TaxID=622671 RepID=A0A562RCX6_9BACT|nr:diguanylate cyclase [Desulfobotulus alkaliphilus]TWI66919.1 diguanylate cyclase (GGDEF)-like protein [Desulfobotulus alkaliphilus]